MRSQELNPRLKSEQIFYSTSQQQQQDGIK